MKISFVLKGLQAAGIEFKKELDSLYTVKIGNILYSIKDTNGNAELKKIVLDNGITKSQDKIASRKALIVDIQAEQAALNAETTQSEVDIQTEQVMSIQKQSNSLSCELSTKSVGKKAIHFHAWDKETQETFYFKNFKNMMIYFDGVDGVEEVETVQEIKPKTEMNLQELTDKGIKDGIESFHYYLEELGYEKAKNIMLEHPTYKAVIKYVEDYEPKSKEVKGETPEIINKIENAQPDKWIAEIIQVKNNKFSVQLNEEGSYVSDGYSTIAIFDTPEDAIKGCSYLNVNKWNIYNPFKKEDDKTDEKFKKTKPIKTVHYSAIVDGKQIESTHTEVYRFDNAAAFKEHLESSDKQSSVNFQLYTDEHYLNFFVPMWHYKNGLKLYVGYDYKDSCYTISTISTKNETVKPAVDAQPEYTPYSSLKKWKITTNSQ